jgi:hypothetical protein
MYADFIAKHIARSNRNLLLVNAAILVVIAGTIGMNWRYAANFVRRDQPTTAAQLGAITDASALRQYFVRVTGEKSAATGMREVEVHTNHGVETSRNVTAEFLYLRVGGKLLVVRAAPAQVGSLQFSGALQPLRADVQARLVDEVIAIQPALKGMILPVMLDTTGYRTAGWWMLAIGGPLGLLAIWNLFRWTQRNGNAGLHPIGKALQHYGEPQSVSEAIENEVRASDRISLGPLTLTQSWLFGQWAFGLRIFKVDDIVWVFKKVTKHYHAFIPTGKTYSMIVHTRAGKRVEISAKEKPIDATLEQIRTRAPWIINGFDARLAKVWQKEKQEVINAADQRKAAAGTQKAVPAHA